MTVIIIIVVILLILFLLGVFDFNSDEDEKGFDSKFETPSKVKYNKSTAQPYFDIYVSQHPSGGFYILRITEDNFAALHLLDDKPSSSSKKALLLALDEIANDYPEQNLSQRLGVCHIKEQNVKIYFADKEMYHNGIGETPFDYMSFEGKMVNKSLLFDIKERYYDQSTRTSKVRTMREKVKFNQL